MKLDRFASLVTCSSLVAVVSLAALPHTVSGQSSSEISGFVLVNCIDSEKPIGALFSGKQVLSERGLGSGRATSGLGVPAGSGVLEVVHPEFGSAELALEISKGSTPIVVAFLERDAKNPAKEPKLALGQVKSNPSKVASFSLLYAADSGMPAFGGAVNGKAVQLQPWRTQKIEGGSLKLESSGQEIFSVTPEQPQAWYVFLAPKKDGGFIAAGVPQIIYEW
jgi:hypothetical protein